MKCFILQKSSIIKKYISYLALTVVIALTAVPNLLAGETPVLNIRSLENFVVLAGSTVTGIPPVSINGNVGLSPAAGSNITGFDGSNVDGTLYVVDASGPAGSVIAASLLTTAKSDLTTAYNDAAGRTPVPTGSFLNPGSGNLGGLNLVAGLYKFTSDCLISGSDLTLTGDANDVWIFQIATKLDMASGIEIILANGAQAGNIFWQVGTSATLGTYCDFSGTILADQSISMGTGASFDGRALAFSGAVTIASGLSINIGSLKPVFTADSSQVQFGSVTNGSIKKDTVVVTNTGGADLEIDSVISSNEYFTVSPVTGTISPGSTKQYYITFAPDSDGSMSGNIYFYHNAKNAIDTIQVSGNAVSPQFTVTPTSLAFGDVRNELTMMDSVTVTNTGTADLVITDVTSSNTNYTTSPTNETILSGESKIFYVTFSPLVDGEQTGYIVFEHNAKKPTDSISVSGTGVSPFFTVTPTSLAFGDVRNELTMMDSVTVTNTGTADLVITDVTSSNTNYTTSPTNETILSGESKIFYVTFSPLVDGEQTGYIVFEHNAKKPTDSISVSGTGVSPFFTVTPTSLAFGDVRNELTMMDSVTVTNTGTADLVITDVTSSNTNYTTSPTNETILSGESKVFYVTFSPLVDGEQTGYIVFEHNAKKPTDSISVSGTGVSPFFTVEQSSLAFGDVRNGISKTKTVTISNTGTADLIITGVESSNSLFTVTPLIKVISPGSEQVYEITFSPLSDGLEYGYIHFSHNAKNKKDSIYLSGTGVSPKFSVNPRELDFGDVENSLTKRDSVTVTNTGTADLIITSITSSNYRFTVLALSATIEPGMSQTFYITFTPLTTGTHEGYIDFWINSNKAKDSIYVTGNGFGEPEFPVFSVNPNSLNFGNVNSGSSKMDSVIITNIGTASMAIYSTSFSNAFYSSNPSIGLISPGQSQKVYITFSPLVPGEQNGYIYFYNNTANLKDSIFVTGVGVGQDISPKMELISNIDFGSVFIGSSKQKSVVVKNVGSSNLIITNIFSSELQYEITPVIGIIKPDETLGFFITFDPIVTGQTNAKIIFRHNAGSDTLNATGKGVENLEVITIAEAIALPIGTEFAVEGIVTRSLGNYTRIQDATAALTIFQSSGSFFNDVEDLDIQMNDNIRVQGSISEVKSLKVISNENLTGYHRISRLNNLPKPLEVTLYDIVNNGEQYESMLITVKGISIRDVGESTFKEDRIYQIKDASDNNNTVVIKIGNSGDNEIDGMPFISEFVTFEGVLSQSSVSDHNSGYELTPVLPTDLRLESVDVSDDQNTGIYTLHNNNPNPFTDFTTISYNLEESGFVNLTVLDILGNEIATLVNEFQKAGNHETTFYVSGDRLSLENGVYFYRLQMGSFNSTHKMILVK